MKTPSITNTCAEHRLYGRGQCPVCAFVLLHVHKDMPAVKKIESCETCPALASLYSLSHGEYSESICRIARRDWGMGYYKDGPAPEWCPLREGPLTLKLEE